MDRFGRIYQLQKLLNNRRAPIPLKKIMKELECAKATAARYIEDMRIGQPNCMWLSLFLRVIPLP